MIDRKLTAMMVEDMIFDPILASKVILGIRVPPHEELRFMWMWTTFYTNDDSGFSTGKSFTHAVIAALRSILFPGRVSGIISKTMEQGKLIFRYFDLWYDRSPIFKWCIAHNGKKPRLIHSTSAFQAFFRGGSEIRVLPPNFLQDAERLRSERWHDGYFDEWTTYGNMEAFNKTLVGRVTKENDFPDCPVRQNHIHLSSTPAFKHNPCYSQIKRINRHVAAGNRDYGRFSVNYRHVPDTKDWRHMVNRKVILNMQTTLPIGIVKSEVDGVWQSDSLSYYNSSIVEPVRMSEPMTAPSMKEMEENIFIVGFDVARGGVQAISRQGNDDFAISVLRVPKINPRPIHCYTMRRYNITAPQMAGAVHMVRQWFNPFCIVYDSGGGGLFVADELKKYECYINNRLQRVVPLVDYGDITPFALQILFPFRRSFYYIERMWGKMGSDSVLLNRLHSHFVQGIQSESIMLAKPWGGWESIGSQWDADEKRKWLNSKPSLPDRDRAAAEMDLAVDQLVMVDVTRDDNGQPLVDTHGMYKFKSKQKKDAAYSLIYSYLGYLIWDFVTNSTNEEGAATVSDSISCNEINFQANRLW